MTVSTTALTDKNLYAYCDNNPVIREDTSGAVWETVFDVVSLGMSIVEVVKNPTDPLAWAGAVGDALDLIPVVTGVGEAIRAFKTADKLDDISDTAKLANKMDDVSEAIGGACFIAGTLVSTSIGYVAIESIRPGDKVWSETPETGEKELKEVVQTFVRKSNELVYVYVNGEEIVTTPEHPFYVPKKGWVNAIELRAGDILVLRSGEYVIVELVQHEILESPVTVYNFEVEDFHTYYVGEYSILVHNSCHANSLTTKKPARGYILRDNDTHEILKYGETTRGYKRYTKSYLNKNNAYMDFVVSGTKAEMHKWQHNKIVNYVWITGQRPPLNKSFY